MKPWRLLAVALVVLGSAPMALAQDVLLPPPAKAPRAAPPKAPARPAKAAAPKPRAQAETAKPAAEHARARAAHELAGIASREASCLREAAQKVARAAERLEGAGGEADVAKRREELDFAVGVMQECRNIADQRAADASPEAAALFDAYDEPAAKVSRALFGFGNISIASGEAAADVVARPLRLHAARFARCYDQALTRAPGIEGTLKLQLRMAPGADGTRPTAVVIPGASPGDAPMHRCLASALMQTPFPPSVAGSDVNLEMAFAPSAPTRLDLAR